MQEAKWFAASAWPRMFVVSDLMALARAIKSDTGNILGQADTANHFASCIDRGLLTSTGNTAC